MKNILNIINMRLYIYQNTVPVLHEDVDSLTT